MSLYKSPSNSKFQIANDKYYYSKNVKILKFNSKGNKKDVKIWLSKDDKILYWGSSANSKVFIKDIISMMYEPPKTKIFMKRKSQYHYFYSLEYWIDKDKNKSKNIYFSCTTKSDYNQWISKLEQLLSKNNIKFKTIKNNISNLSNKRISKCINRSTNQSSGEKFNIYGFGCNNWDQLCLKTEIISIYTPTLSHRLFEYDVVAIACGWSNLLILTEQNNLIHSGSRVGMAGNECSKALQTIHFRENNIIVDIACGDAHSLILTENGEIFSWGSNFFGQCGDGTMNDINIPKKINFKQSITQIACGSNFSVCLTQNNELYTWGNNGCGQLGHDSYNNSLRPSRVNLPHDFYITLVAAGAEHIVVASNSYFYVWGWNGCGQLGLQDKKDRIKPTKMSIKLSANIIDISCGASHSGAILKISSNKIVEMQGVQNLLYMWGSNKLGQLGLSSEVEIMDIPTCIHMRELPIELSCGAIHTAILTEKRSVLTTGNNVYGQLGYAIDNFAGDGKNEFDLEKRRTMKDKSYGFKSVKSIEEKEVENVSCGGNFTVLLAKRMWVNDEDVEKCMGNFSSQCKITFTIRNRKHHCRNCCGIFCSSCSSKTLILPQISTKESVRVCDNCYEKLV